MAKCETHPEEEICSDCHACHICDGRRSEVVDEHLKILREEVAKCQASNAAADTKQAFVDLQHFIEVEPETRFLAIYFLVRAQCTEQDGYFQSLMDHVVQEKVIPLMKQDLLGKANMPTMPVAPKYRDS